MPVGHILEIYEDINDVFWTVKLKTQNGVMIQLASKLGLLEAVVE